MRGGLAVLPRGEHESYHRQFPLQRNSRPADRILSADHLIVDGDSIVEPETSPFCPLRRNQVDLHFLAIHVARAIGEEKESV